MLTLELILLVGFTLAAFGIVGRIAFISAEKPFWDIVDLIYYPAVAIGLVWASIVLDPMALARSYAAIETERDKTFKEIERIGKVRPTSDISPALKGEMEALQQDTAALEGIAKDEVTSKAEAITNANDAYKEYWMYILIVALSLKFGKGVASFVKASKET